MNVQVGSWIHAEPKDIHLIDLHATQPSTRSKKRLKQPWLTIQIGTTEILISKNEVLWGLLDALFPFDPFPRQPVNEAIQQAPGLFMDDLRLMLLETETAIISIYAPSDHEITDPTSYSGRLWDGSAATLITSSPGLKAADCIEIADYLDGDVIPGMWRDRNGTHLIPCVVVKAEGGAIHIGDLGSKLVVGGIHTDSMGTTIRPLPIESMKKDLNWMLKLKTRMERHKEVLRSCDSMMFKASFMPKQQLDIMYSTEAAEIEHKRWFTGSIVSNSFSAS